MAVKILVDYTGELHCSAQHTPSGSVLITDAPVDNGGRGEAFSPTDLVATGLASCMLTIMGIVAKQRALDLRGTRVEVIKEMASDPVRRIGALRVVITVPVGAVPTEEDRTRLRNAAETCPVKKSLHPEVLVTVEYRFD